MNQDNDQENNPDVSEDFLLKRNRGRPRKHPRHSLSRGEDALTSRNQNPNYAENTGIPPVFQGLNGNPSHQANPVNDDVMVGQAVSGVIDSAFDAGYLLTVRKKQDSLPTREEWNGSSSQWTAVANRGTVVPVLLQPATLSNGKVASQPPHLAASKGQQVSGSSDTAEEKSVNPMLTVGNQIFPTNLKVVMTPFRKAYKVKLFSHLKIYRTGKMTELLKAVQENMRENQASRIEQPTIDSEETET
ncbi:Detected protein of unknown function [Hibiscus syriacus]|uniref:Uncharacterized protein n=1 Tax=Hibiscus syriacus TaxID=106335 RepID=A0A6A2XNC5_HIBSY|nr:Detected protein of unknown function [Hibiscus syriacus]